MIERRQHERIEIDGWASLKHPLLGTMTGAVEDISVGGLSIRVNDDKPFFVMMELDAQIHSESLKRGLPEGPVQVVRVNRSRIGLKFLESQPQYCQANGNNDRPLQHAPQTAS